MAAAFPGASDPDEVEEPGTEHYQCCIHPSMRLDLPRAAATEDGRSDQEAFMTQDLMERDIAGAGPGVWSIRRLYALEDAQIDGLADLLIDCRKAVRR